MSEQIAPIPIDPTGDLILEVRQEDGDVPFTYRVHSTVLRERSQYFEHLLSGRFKEGQELAAALDALKAAGCAPAEVPADRLPRISIVYVGRISKVSSIRDLTADFLRVLHDQPLATAHIPVGNLANLTVVADRFDALPHFARYAQRKKYLQAADAKPKNKSATAITEERVRQKLLIGLLLDYPPWVTKYSKHLIMRDSAQWKPDVDPDTTTALWWDMPKGVEDEMIHRRECILETINSLQAHFLKLYTSGERQCRLGYDSSGQCDSFQLGEMVRFFMRQGTLRMQGTIYDPTEPTHYTGDIERLVESFRKVSSYQVDNNHAHCGLRSRLIPLLDLIHSHLSLDTGSQDIGICADCWNKNRSEYAWSSAKRPVMWTPNAFTGRRERRASGCLAKHVAVRDMFMAAERAWTAGNSYQPPARSTAPSIRPL